MNLISGFPEGRILFQNWELLHRHIGVESSHELKKPLCLSIPGKIIALYDSFASVDYGHQGIRENVNNMLVEGKIGEYVLVQGGFAIKILTEAEAQEIIEVLRMMETDFGSAEGMI
jgi:hydrogenase assembly chaperone HypC/HupF